MLGGARKYKFHNETVGGLSALLVIGVLNSQEAYALGAIMRPLACP